jgi:hypothetical protein
MLTDPIVFGYESAAEASKIDTGRKDMLEGLI